MSKAEREIISIPITAYLPLGLLLLWAPAKRTPMKRTSKSTQINLPNLALYHSSLVSYDKCIILGSNQIVVYEEFPNTTDNVSPCTCTVRSVWAPVVGQNGIAVMYLNGMTRSLRPWNNFLIFPSSRPASFSSHTDAIPTPRRPKNTWKDVILGMEATLLLTVRP